MIRDFHQWLEAQAQNWHDFEASRGRVHRGFNPAGGNTTAMIPASDDDTIKNAMYSDDDAIYKFKLLHDRMLDATEVKPQDVAMFINHMLANIPGDSVRGEDGMYSTNPEFSEIKSRWSGVSYGMEKGRILTHQVQSIENAINYTANMARQQTPAGQYFKALFPLLKDLFKQLKTYSADYRDTTADHRQDTRALQAWRREQDQVDPNEPPW